jgi:hypothetical protein
MSLAPATAKPKGYNSDYNFFQRKTLKGVAIEFPNLKVIILYPVTFCHGKGFNFFNVKCKYRIRTANELYPVDGMS